jgi:hypothetical protein
MTAQPLTYPMETEISSRIKPLNQEQINQAIALLDSWCHVDEEETQEQSETLAYLIKVLDEDRPNYRKLFS